MDSPWNDFFLSTVPSRTSSCSLNSSITMDPTFLLPYCDYCGQKHLHRNVVYSVYMGKAITTCKPGTGCSKCPLVITLPPLNLPRVLPQAPSPPSHTTSETHVIPAPNRDMCICRAPTMLNVVSQATNVCQYCRDTADGFLTY